eukprot:PLAT14586.1.p1 GENE.PLAT14586.1~~PLAT14586.1.p1  ORF type:complete len:239 (-),score=83.35 PLAT14586.1:181-897(-)
MADDSAADSAYDKPQACPFPSCDTVVLSPEALADHLQAGVAHHMMALLAVMEEQRDEIRRLQEDNDILHAGLRFLTAELKAVQSGPMLAMDLTAPAAASISSPASRRGSFTRPESPAFSTDSYGHPIAPSDAPSSAAIAALTRDLARFTTGAGGSASAGALPAVGSPPLARGVSSSTAPKRTTALRAAERRGSYSSAPGLPTRAEVSRQPHTGVFFDEAASGWWTCCGNRSRDSTHCS